MTNQRARLRRHTFMIIAAMMIMGGLLAVGSSSSLVAVAKEEKLLLPTNLTPQQAKAECETVELVKPTTVKKCVGYYGDVREHPKKLEDGRVPVTNEKVADWYAAVVARCGMTQFAEACIANAIKWEVDKPLEEDSWEWECTSPSNLSDVTACFKEATTRLLGTTLTFWMSDKLSPAVAPRYTDVELGEDSAPDGEPGTHLISWRVSDVIWSLQQSTKILTILTAVLGVVVGCVRVALTQRARPFVDVLQMFLTIIAVSALAAVTVQILVDWGDEFSPWIMEQAYGAGDLTEFKNKFTDTFAALDQLAMILVFGPLIMLNAVLQMGFMIFRNGAIVIMLGLLPWVAATSAFEAGRTWFKRVCMWLLGFILYKPVAAIIYAGGLLLMNRAGGIPEESDQMTKQLLQVTSGMLTLMLALLCLPAMIKLFAPIAATGSSSVFSTAAVGGAAVTGAVAVGSLMAGAGAGAAAAFAQGARPTGPSGNGLSSGPPAGSDSGGPSGGYDGGGGGAPTVNGNAKPQLESGGNRLPEGQRQSQIATPRTRELVGSPPAAGHAGSASPPGPSPNGGPANGSRSEGSGPPESRSGQRPAAGSPASGAEGAAGGGSAAAAEPTEQGSSSGQSAAPGASAVQHQTQRVSGGNVSTGSRPVPPPTPSPKVEVISGAARNVGPVTERIVNEEVDGGDYDGTR